MSWLPRDRTEPLAADARPWIPPSFARKRIDWSMLSYIVVDELSTDVAGLIVSEWPRLDQKGRVRYPGSSWRAGALLSELDVVLAERLVPKGVADLKAAQTRAVRIGDAFAANAGRPRGRIAAIPKLSRWLKSPVYDVSADAREAAKMALNAAVAPTMSVDDVDQIAAELAE